MSFRKNSLFPHRRPSWAVFFGSSEKCVLGLMNGQDVMICFGNGLFVAVSASGSGNRVMTSPDGINWTLRTSATNNYWTSVCYGNGLFVAVASGSVMTSP